MPIPSITSIRKPLLEFLAKDRQYHLLDECVEYLEKKFSLTEEEKNERIGGKTPSKKFRKRVTSAVSDFRIAELIEDETKPGDASFRISKTGLKLLKSRHDEITNRILKQFGEYSSLDKSNEEKSGEEKLQEYSRQYEQRVQLDLLQQIKRRCTSVGFEKLCLKLFEEMGYGESKHTGKIGDRGIDGVISADKLGLNQIYVQTKKYEQIVLYDDVDKFYGKCARDKVSGIFVTTSDFSKNTIEEMKKERLIRLISGQELVKYLYQFNIGIEPMDKIELKQINLEELDGFN